MCEVSGRPKAQWEPASQQSGSMVTAAVWTGVAAQSGGVLDPHAGILSAPVRSRAPGRVTGGRPGGPALLRREAARRWNQV
ncbi:hypothetical protein GCM10017687_60800 [Streptomyces echinatus]